MRNQQFTVTVTMAYGSTMTSKFDTKSEAYDYYLDACSKINKVRKIHAFWYVEKNFS